jgi:hypothetical protein
MILPMKNKPYLYGDAAFNDYRRKQCTLLLKRYEQIRHDYGQNVNTICKN